MHMKHTATMMVGRNAAAASLRGDTPSPKKRERIDWPAGFGALAMTVRPPPVTAPDSTAYLSAGVRPPAWAASRVMAALSLNDVRIVAPVKSAHSPRCEMMGPSHQ